MLHPEKNIVPEPRFPDMGGSSPRCDMKLYTEAFSPARQYPAFPAVRSTPHLLGHMRQFLRESLKYEAAFFTELKVLTSNMARRYTSLSFVVRPVSHVPVDKIYDGPFLLRLQMREGYSHSGIRVRLYLLIRQIYYSAVGSEFFCLAGDGKR